MKKLLIILALLTGCATPNWQPHGSVVTIRQPGSIASGAVIGENLVVTAAHCVDEDGYIKIRVSKNPLKKYTTFYKLAEMPNKIENFVCLYGSHHFNSTSIFKVGCDSSDSAPAFVQTRRGLFKIDDFVSQKGDSGSAIIDKHGHLLGVHYGSQTYRNKKIPIFLLFKD